MKNLKKKISAILLTAGMLISVSSSMAQAFENDKDNPIGMTYADDYTNINYRNYDLSNYALNWSGTGNKETVKRDK